MNTEEESKKARALEEIKKIPLPLSDENFTALWPYPFEDLPKEYQDEMNRVLQARYAKARAEGKLN